MIRTLILPAVSPPYLVVEIVAGLYHLLGERRVLAIHAEGVERLVAEPPFRLFGHWISACSAVSETMLTDRSATRVLADPVEAEGSTEGGRIETEMPLQARS